MQNLEIKLKKLQKINIKVDNSFNYKAQKIKLKYDSRADNEIFFCIV